MSALPSYRQYFLLRGPGANSWRLSKTDPPQHLTEDAAGAYSLDPRPGVTAVWPPIASAAPVEPAAMARDAQGLIYVLDGADMRVKVIDPNGKTPARVLPGVGGFGADARRFRAASDIALWERDALAVADAGHGAVKVFSAYPYSLVAVWTQFGKPTRLACGAKGLLWILDQRGNRVVGVDRDGLICVELPGLVTPNEVVVTAAGDVLVLDGTKLLFFLATGGTPVSVGTVPGGECIAVDEAGIIYVATNTGLIYAFAPDGLGGWQQPGVGVVGQQTSTRALLWLGGSTLLGLVQPQGAKAAQFWQFDSAAGHEQCGRLTTENLDSGLAGNIWRRIELDADIPSGSSIEVSAECFDNAGGNAIADLQPPSIVLSGEMRDCLVQSGPTDKGASGRYLRLHLTFRGDGVVTPVLRAIRVWITRDSWVKYLPAIYQEDDESRSFLSRFLAIVQTNFEDFDEKIDDIWTYFDPLSVPDDWYLWLAAWIALPIEPTWTSAQKRSVLKNAGQQYRLRGTIAGLQQLVSDYAGADRPAIRTFSPPPADLPAGRSHEGLACGRRPAVEPRLLQAASARRLQQHWLLESRRRAGTQRRSYCLGRA